MKPDPQRVRAVSGQLSEAERMWKGLPNTTTMEVHMGALQKALSNMLGPPLKREVPSPIEPTNTDAPGDLGPGDGSPDDELEEALGRLGQPDAVSIKRIREVADDPLSEWLRAKPQFARHRLARCGYEKVVHPTGRDGCWQVNGYTVVYARRELALQDRVAAAKAFVKAERNRGRGLKNSATRSSTPRRAIKVSDSQLPASDQGRSE